jgi:catechol 2,3-dioxygenase-like lactoylglutathione lyase family enzyme
VKLPVGDLQRSVDWYRQLLDLELHREFVEVDQLAGAVLTHKTGTFVISLRSRDFVPGQPSLTGFDFFSLEVSSVSDLEELRARAEAMNARHSEIVDRGPDGRALDIYDPDGMAVRFLAFDSEEDPAFIGVRFDEDQAPSFYGTPRLQT